MRLDLSQYIGTSISREPIRLLIKSKPELFRSCKILSVAECIFWDYPSIGYALDEILPNLESGETLRIETEVSLNNAQLTRMIFSGSEILYRESPFPDENMEPTTNHIHQELTSRGVRIVIKILNASAQKPDEEIVYG